jgi:hypothetical protein
MMDEAERAYDGGLMSKALGGEVQAAEEEFSDTLDGMSEEEIQKQMISSTRMAGNI